MLLAKIWGHNLGRCYKIYVQGQNEGQIDDHFPASNEFILPYYADTSKAIKVEVDGVTKLRSFHWELKSRPVAKVEFLGSKLKVFDTQTVKITFFVDLKNFPVFTSKGQALEKIKGMCGPTANRTAT